jgi:hexosaminidase
VLPKAGAYPLSPATGLIHPPELAGEAAWLRGALGASTGCFLASGEGPGIELIVDADALPVEGYRLEVTASGVELRGGSAAGVFAGLQTLRQLLPANVLRRGRVAAGPWAIPACVIEDAPVHGWRGVMLDVARHFLPKQDVLRFVDLMAVHRLNVLHLHLHLTDDQGWRIEVPAWPRLTSVGAWRTGSMRGSRQHEIVDDRPHGGFYPGADLREIVAYAAERHITVVPEIDLPGHVQAVAAAYPSLGAVPVDGVRTRWGGRTGCSRRRTRRCGSAPTCSTRCARSSRRRTCASAATRCRPGRGGRWGTPIPSRCRAGSWPSSPRC